MDLNLIMLPSVSWTRSAKMTKFATFPEKHPLVCAIAYDGLCTFEFGIAVELFALARPEFEHWNRFATVKAESGPIRAAAGLLDCKSATTHWRYTDKLAQMYPAIDVDPDVLFVEGERVFTSAGSAAGLDLGLHIIRQDFGAKVAASVARRLVLPAQRDGGQRQFVPRPEPKARAGSGLAALQDQVRASIDEDWPVERMANAAATSGRTLARRFHEEAGTTPLNWLKVERVSRAAELLETGTIPLADVWEVCGFGSAETFRREFRKTMGVPPVKYRERLGARQGQ